MKYYHLKWIYLIIFFIIGIQESTDSFRVISDYYEVLLVMSFVFIVIMKFITIEKMKSSFGIKFYLVEIVEAFLIFTILALILTEFSINLKNTVIVESILFLFIGYFDFFFAKRINKDYPIDRLGMYTVLAIVYVLAELNYFDLGNVTGLRNSIAFIVFLDIFIMIIISRFKKNKSTYLTSNKIYTEDYLTLSPKKDIIDSPYFEMLDFGIKSPDVRNIAVTSIYGGGKSSIIESYLKNANNHNHINISLAHFDDVDKSDNILNTLQLKIIKHLFYKVNPNELPRSTYVRRCVSAKSIGMNFLFVYLIYIVFLLISNIFFSDNLELEMSNIAMHFIPSLFVLIYIIIKKSTFRIQKVDTKIGTFILGNKEEESIFDKYIEELVYFFKATRKTIVIIEDIDRFRDVSIFNALRELNILLNESDEIIKKITFIYALNDYLIEEENKTNRKAKFFDLIIPIIPISSSYNTSGIFFDLLKNRKLTFESPDRNDKDDISIEPSLIFLEKLSFYISDMRTLKNIVNEYIITLKAFNANQGINLTNLKNKHFLDKLFSIIVYKNFMPKDYSYLHENNGVVYTFLNNAGEFKDPLEKDLGDKLKMLTKQKDYLDTFGLSSDLLDTILSNHFRMTQPNQIFYAFDSIDTTVNTGNYNTNSSSGILSILKGKNYKVNNRGALQNFDDQVKNILKLGESDWYTVTIKDRNEIGSEIYRVQSKLSRIKHMKLSEIICGIPSSDLLETYAILSYNTATKKSSILNKENYIREVKNSIPEILLFLLKNGYIAEDYDMYMNYFIEGKRTESDRKFIQALYSSESLSPEILLNDFEGILKVITPNDFKNHSVLNYSFLDYLLVNEMYERLMLVFISLDNDFGLTFLSNYISSTTFPKLLTNYLLRYQSRYVDLILNSSEQDDSVCDIVINSILMYNDVINLDKILSNDSVLKFNDFSRILLYNSELEDPIIVENVKRNLKIVNVKFNTIDDSSDNNDLIGYIYTNNLYKLNHFVVKKIIENKLSVEVVPTYDLIVKNRLTIMQKYVDDNINDFVENVLLHGDIFRKETSESISSILNNTHLNIDLGNKLISNQLLAFDIEYIKDITNESYYSDLVFFDRVAYSINNLASVFAYIKNKGLSRLYDKLVGFILENMDLLILDENSALFKSINSYLSNIISSEEISNKHIREIFSIDFWDFTFMKSLSEETLITIIVEKLITFEKLVSILEVNVIISLIYKASINDGLLDITIFDGYINCLEDCSEFNAFIQGLMNDVHRKELIQKYYSCIDEMYLFKLIPKEIRNNLLLGKHAPIHITDDWFKMVEVGEKLNWYRIKYKDDRPIKLIPRPSSLKKFN